MRHYLFSILLFLVFVGFVGSTEYEVSVKNVEVWVKAFDDSGYPVLSLTQNDFEVYEDNRKLAATCFEETRPAAPLAASQRQTAFPAASPLKFVLFLDLFNTSQPEYLNIKPKVGEFLNQIADKGWEVMAAGLTPQGKLGVMTPFTRDANRVHNVLEKVQANANRDLRILKNERELSDILDSSGRSFDTAISQAYRLAKVYSRQEMEISKFSLEALESFGDYLRAQNLRDHMVVLFISGGFNADPGRQYYEVLNKIVGEPDPVKLPESIRDTDFSFLNEVKKGMARLNRSNITVYSINTRGSFMAGLDVSGTDTRFAQYVPDLLQDYQDALAGIAEETGGLSFQNSRNFKVGFDQILDDLSSGYVLCYNAPSHKKADEYHHIKVVCNKPGVKLRYRQGYVD